MMDAEDFRACLISMGYNMVKQRVHIAMGCDQVKLKVVVPMDNVLVTHVI